MKKLFVFYVLAMLCAAMTVLFGVLCFTQSFVNVVFVIVFVFLTKWPLDEASRIKPIRRSAYIPEEPVAVTVQPVVKADEHYRERVEEFHEFYNKNEEVLNKLRKQYWSYIQLFYKEGKDLPEAYTAATEKMMLQYGDDIYTAFKSLQPGYMLCLSLTMSVANLKVARTLIDKITLT